MILITNQEEFVFGAIKKLTTTSCSKFNNGYNARSSQTYNFLHLPLSVLDRFGEVRYFDGV